MNGVIGICKIWCPTPNIAYPIPNLAFQILHIPTCMTGCACVLEWGIKYLKYKSHHCGAVSSPVLQIGQGTLSWTLDLPWLSIGIWHGPTWVSLRLGTAPSLIQEIGLGIAPGPRFLLESLWGLQCKAQKAARHRNCQVLGRGSPSALPTGKPCNSLPWQPIFSTWTREPTPVPVPVLTISWLLLLGWGHDACSIYGAMQTSHKDVPHQNVFYGTSLWLIWHIMVPKSTLFLTVTIYSVNNSWICDSITWKDMWCSSGSLPQKERNFMQPLFVGFPDEQQIRMKAPHCSDHFN